MNYSFKFKVYNWIVLISIYLIVIAGSFVRITGSGMGCPDWPKCFGQWIPPTQESQLPNDYKNIYISKREKKIKRFCSFLNSIGLKETSQKISADPTLLIEDDFNGQKTWTEYVNRLIGFLSGNLMIILFIWMFIRYRIKKSLLLQGLNIILMGIQGWFGSIVVASNLVPWTITVHLFMALLIIGIQIKIVFLVSGKKFKMEIPRFIKTSILLILIITCYQMFLGTQVRESIDELTKSGFGRDTWTDKLGLPFYIHRSFSWLVLIGMVILFIINEKKHHIMSLRYAFVTLSLGLISGVLLAYADMPGLIQVSHLLFASVLFGQMLWIHLELKVQND
tara:strand:- start:182 stop:1189 length:1008 start_codon:yes stop_codon:yes gene_type:complete